MAATQTTASGRPSRGRAVVDARPAGCRGAGPGGCRGTDRAVCSISSMK